MFPELKQRIKARVIEVLSTAEVPRLMQQQIHARLGLEVTRAKLSDILTELRGGRAVCYDARSACYWMANRAAEASADDSSEQVLEKLRELGEVDVEALPEKLPQLRKVTIEAAVRRLVLSGRVRMRAVPVSRHGVVREVQLVRVDRFANLGTGTSRRVSRTRAQLDALAALFKGEPDI